MKQLEKKYRLNNLTPEELQKLRNIVNKAQESEVESYMYTSWLNDLFDEKSVTVECLEAIKAKIDKSITPQRQSFTLIKRIGKIAAAILFPLLMLTALYLYKETIALSTEKMIVSTSKGERANINLPDGTKIIINSETFLTYAPQSYNKTERSISFEGEAYFDVTKKESLPFIVKTKNLIVKVLGTRFNLLARDKYNTIELVLEEGHVLLSSLKEEKELFTNQKAIFDCSTGEIFVTSEKTPQNASAWKRGELIFANAPLKDVVKALENNYGVNINIASSFDLSNDLFSGTVTGGNFIEALEIIKTSYNLEYTVVGNEVIFFEN